MSNASFKKSVAKSRYPATAQRKKKRGGFNYNKLTAVIVMAISSMVSILVIWWLFLLFT